MPQTASEAELPLVPRAPLAPAFGEPRAEAKIARPEPPAPEPRLAPPVESPPTPSFIPPRVESLPPPRIVDPGPSPLELARGRVLAELERAIGEIAGLRGDLMAGTERQVVELAGAIARRVIARELSVDPEIMLGLAAEGLDALAERDRVKVRVGTLYDDQVIATFRDRVKAQVANCDVLYDEKLAPGQCVVETELGRVDESLESRLALVMTSLLAEGEDDDGTSGHGE